MRIVDPADIDRLDFSTDRELLPVIAQHADTGEVLMVGYADRQALARTIEEGRLWFWSRKRQQLWRKGETSGNELRVVSLDADCDADAVLARVEPAGPTCHTGARSCFGTPPVLTGLGDEIRDRLRHPDGPGYTRRLLADPNVRTKKLGEEAVELALACASGERPRIVEEAADLLYHALVACAAAGVTEADVLAELGRRRG